MNSGKNLYAMIGMNKAKEYVRLDIVRYAKEHGIKPAASEFGTTRKTVKKWIRRYDGTIASLRDESKAPKNPARKISEELEKEIIKIRKKRGRLGAERMRREYNLSCSAKAINRVLRDHGLIQKRRRKHKTKRCLRAIKALWPAFRQICVDTKELGDIPEYWPAINLGHAPAWQYTARDCTTGTTFLGFADERSLTHAVNFIRTVLGHLAGLGIDLHYVIVQTDNGSEFIGSVMAKNPSAFTDVIEKEFGATHRRIPPKRHTWQADVETFHNTVEVEFFEVESFPSMDTFKAKINTYLTYYNLARVNSNKEYKTPVQLLKEKEVKATAAMLPPIFLGDLLPLSKPFTKPTLGGYHVWSLPLI